MFWFLCDKINFSQKKVRSEKSISCCKVRTKQRWISLKFSFLSSVGVTHDLRLSAKRRQISKSGLFGTKSSQTSVIKVINCRVLCVPQKIWIISDDGKRLKIVCCGDIFEITSKNPTKIGGVFYVVFEFRHTKTCKVFQVLGFSSISFTRQATLNVWLTFR